MYGMVHHLQISQNSKSLEEGVDRLGILIKALRVLVGTAALKRSNREVAS